MGSPITSGNAQLSTEMIAGLLCPSDDGDIWLPLGGHLFRGFGLWWREDELRLQCLRHATSASTGSLSPRTNGDCSAKTLQFRDKDVTDGLSNTVAFAETLRTIYNGYTPAWAYRGWVMLGIDLGREQDQRLHLAGRHREPRCASRLKWYSSAGSLHGNGANMVMADGSVHYLAEETEQPVLEALSTMAGEEVALCRSSHTSAAPKK